MIGLDTNVIVRYVAQDDSKQSPKATRLVESLTSDTPGYVSLGSVVALVLKHCCAPRKSLWPMLASYGKLCDFIKQGKLISQIA